MTPDAADIGARLRAAQQEAGKSIAQIARDLGKDKAQVTRWFNGRRKPSAANARLLTDYFKKPADWFVTPPGQPRRRTRLDELAAQVEALRDEVRRISRGGDGP